MPKLSRGIASEITKAALVRYTKAAPKVIVEESPIEHFKLSEIAKRAVHVDIVRAVERAGFPTVFSFQDLLDAEAVRDVIDSVIKGTRE
jgi:ABC-type uncharacterized transport system YnjBCD ATPase subunit